MQARTVVTAWALMMVTLVLCALVWANWYEFRDYDAFPDDAGVQRALATGWEPVQFSNRNFWYWRRPRLTVWR